MTFTIHPSHTWFFEDYSIWIINQEYDSDKNLYRFHCEEHIFDHVEGCWTYFDIKCSLREENGVFRKVRQSRRQYDYYTGSERLLRRTPGAFYLDDSFNGSRPEPWEILAQHTRNQLNESYGDGGEPYLFYIVSCKDVEDITIKAIVGDNVEKYLDREKELIRKMSERGGKIDLTKIDLMDVLASRPLHNKDGR